MTHESVTRDSVRFDPRVVQVTCPTCGSAPGRLCVSVYGQALRRLHMSRLTASIRERERARSKRPL